MTRKYVTISAAVSFAISVSVLDLEPDR
jgi:hypothetical protein